MIRITAIQRVGIPRTQRVRLDCGHHVDVSDADVKRQQLYVGRAATCPLCEKAPRKPMRREVERP